MFAANVDDNWILMPGFKVILHNATNYGGLSSTLDNSTRTTLRVFQSPFTNATQLCQTFYNGTQLLNYGNL